jgi:hypothetical protein
MPVEGAQIKRADLSARRARVGQPREAGRYGSADRRIEPQLASASLAPIPYRDNLLRIDDGLALGLGAFCRLRCACSSGFAFLCSPVRTHAERLLTCGPKMKDPTAWTGTPPGHEREEQKRLPCVFKPSFGHRRIGYLVV